MNLLVVERSIAAAMRAPKDPPAMLKTPWPVRPFFECWPSPTFSPRRRISNAKDKGVPCITHCGSRKTSCAGAPYTRFQKHHYGVGEPSGCTTAAVHASGYGWAARIHGDWVNSSGAR